MEVWKPVIGFEKQYEVSSLGKIRNLDKNITSKLGKMVLIKGKLLKPGLDKDGYVRMRFCLGSKQNDIVGKSIGVHIVVAMAFINNPLNKPLINHKNGIKTDNRIDNLEWCTSSENVQHAYDTGLACSKKGEKCHKSKLKEDDIVSIRNSTKSYNELSVYYNVTVSAIRLIIQRKNWKHIL